MVHVWQCSTCTALVVASCSYPLKCCPDLLNVACSVAGTPVCVMFLPSAVVLPYTSALVWIGLPVSVFMYFWFFLFCPFHCTVCPLDAQHLTAALVAVEDLDLGLEQSSIEAVEELLFIPTLSQLSLNVVSDHVSPLSIVSPPPVAGVVCEWSLSLGCSGSCCVNLLFTEVLQ